MPDELPSGDKAVYIFLEMIALGFVLAAVETLVAGKPWRVYVSCLALGIVFLVAGIKWPRIKARLSVDAVSTVEKIAANRSHRIGIFAATVLLLLAVIAYKGYAYYHGKAAALSKPPVTTEIAASDSASQAVTVQEKPPPGVQGQTSQKPAIKKRKTARVAVSSGAGPATTTPPIPSASGPNDTDAVQVHPIISVSSTRVTRDDSKHRVTVTVGLADSSDVEAAAIAHWTFLWDGTPLPWSGNPTPAEAQSVVLAFVPETKSGKVMELEADANFTTEEYPAFVSGTKRLVIRVTADYPDRGGRTKYVLEGEVTNNSDHLNILRTEWVKNPTESRSTTLVPQQPPMTKKQEETQVAGSPPGIIPEDPAKVVDAVTRMRHSLSNVLGKKETITFLMSWPKDDNTYLVLVSKLLGEACRDTPRQCWFTQPRFDNRDLDRPPIQGSDRGGITVHGPDARALATALGAWFSTYSTSTFPPELNGYKEEATKEIIWIEIGPGSPWKPATK